MERQTGSYERQDEVLENAEALHDKLRDLCTINDEKAFQLNLKGEAIISMEGITPIKLEFDSFTASEWQDFSDYDTERLKKIGSRSSIKIMSLDRALSKEQSVVYTQFIQVTRSSETGYTIELEYNETEEGFDLEEAILHTGGQQFGPDSLVFKRAFDNILNWLEASDAA